MMFGKKKAKGREQYVKHVLDAFINDFNEYFKPPLEFNEHGDRFLNRFANHYYDKGNVSWENRTTYNYDAERLPRHVNCKHPDWHKSEDAIMSAIKGYINEVIHNHPEYDFWYRWTLVDARTDCYVICRQTEPLMKGCS